MQEGRAADTDDAGQTRSLGMRAFPLAFSDPLTESAYRSKWQRATRVDHMFWTIGAVVGYSLITGMLWIASEPGFIEFQWFRIFVALPLLVGAMIYVLRGPVNDRIYFPLFVAKTFAIYANSVFSYALADAADFRLYLFESCVVLVFVLYFYPVRWALTTTFAVLAAIAATIAAIIADAGPAGQTVPLEMILLVTYGLFATCTFAGYSKEVLSRRNFRQIQVLRQRQAESEQLAEQASNAAVAKARFLAVAAHELRTPLNAMLGFTELVRVTHDPASRPSTMIERFAAIERDANHLHQLVESVLTVSKDGSSSLAENRQFFQIEPLLEIAARDYSAAIHGGSVSASQQTGAPHIVNGDPAIYRTLTDCLIRHARALTGTQSDIEIDFRTTDSGAFLLCVHPVDRRPEDTDWAETIVVDIDGTNGQTDQVETPAGLLKLLAESQGTLLKTLDIGCRGKAFALEIPDSLVTRLTSVDSRSPVEVRAAC